MKYCVFFIDAQDIFMHFEYIIVYFSKNVHVNNRNNVGGELCQKMEKQGIMDDTLHHCLCIWLSFSVF